MKDFIKKLGLSLAVGLMEERVKAFLMFGCEGYIQSKLFSNGSLYLVICYFRLIIYLYSWFIKMRGYTCIYINIYELNYWMHLLNLFNFFN